jgi:sec-independent protein translocase protein TatA
VGNDFVPVNGHQLSLCEVVVMSAILAVFFGLPGPLEMLIVLAILLLLFGNRLPSVMRSLGQGITEFKKGIREDESQDEMRITQDRKE